MKIEKIKTVSYDPAVIELRCSGCDVYIVRDHESKFPEYSHDFESGENFCPDCEPGKWIVQHYHLNPANNQKLEFSNRGDAVAEYKSMTSDEDGSCSTIENDAGFYMKRFWNEPA